MAHHKDRLYHIDALRFLAAFAVVAQHYLERSAPEAAATFLRLGPGVFGVALFFMISGYVLPFSMRKHDTAQTFFLRRAFRIFPLYLLTLASLLICGALGFAPFAALQALSIWEILANAALVAEYVSAPTILGVAWSLSLEVIWYIFFWIYFAYWGAGKIGHVTLFAALALVSLALLSICVDQRLPLGRFSMLLAALYGAMLCAHRLDKIDQKRAIAASLACLGAISFALWVGFGHFTHPKVTWVSAAIPWCISFLLFTTLCTTNLTFFHDRRHPARLASLGALSYGIYLLHEPIYVALAIYLKDGALLLSATLVTLMISTLAHILIERPAMRLGRRLTKTPNHSQHKTAIRPGPNAKVKI